MSDRPFVDRPPGSIDEATRVAAKAAQHWGLPTPTLLRIGMNAIFTAGAVVLRVSRPSAPTAAALDLATVLRDVGIRVPAPMRPDAFTDGEIGVTAWERLVPVDREPDWQDVGRMVRRVHALDAAALPAGYPLPPGEAFPWWRFDEMLTMVGDMVDASALAGIEAAIERHRGWADDLDRVVCHGDVHPGNVMATAADTVLLDWDLACRGPAAWDHGMLLRLPRWGWPTRWYDAFAAGYGCSFVADPTAEAIAELRLVAATLMRLRAARDDPLAMPEARLRLAYWRGDPDAPAWTAV